MRLPCEQFCNGGLDLLGVGGAVVVEQGGGVGAVEQVGGVGQAAVGYDLGPEQPGHLLGAGTVRIGRSLRGEQGLRFKSPKTPAGTRTVGLGPAAVAKPCAGIGPTSWSGASPSAPPTRPGRTWSSARPTAPRCDPTVSTQFRTLARRGWPPPRTCISIRCGIRRRSWRQPGCRHPDIAAQLGHADGGALALRVYVHPLEENKRRAAAQLDQVLGGS